jgi:thiol-disulfide isomerase/thioredoxin
MNKIKKLLIGFSFIVLYIFFGVICDGNHVQMIALTLSAIFIITILIYKSKIKITLFDCIILIVPIILLLILAGVLSNDFSRTLQYLVFIPISSLLSFIYLKTKRVLVIPLALILFYCIGKFLFITLFTYISNKDAEKNISFPEVTLLDSKKKRVTLKKDKIIVLDFWSTSCGICFEKFPDLEKLSNKYKTNKKVEIYAVNFPLKRDNFDSTVKILNSIGYKFNKAYALSSSEIENKLHFNTFPHLIIIKDGKIRYDGMFETEKNTLIFSTESEINKLLRE